MWGGELEPKHRYPPAGQAFTIMGPAKGAKGARRLLAKF